MSNMNPIHLWTLYTCLMVALFLVLLINQSRARKRETGFLLGCIEKANSVANRRGEALRKAFFRCSCCGVFIRFSSVSWMLRGKESVPTCWHCYIQKCSCKGKHHWNRKKKGAGK